MNTIFTNNWLQLFIVIVFLNSNWLTNMQSVR